MPTDYQAYLHKLYHTQHMESTGVAVKENGMFSLSKCPLLASPLHQTEQPQDLNLTGDVSLCSSGCYVYSGVALSGLFKYFIYLFSSY